LQELKEIILRSNKIKHIYKGSFNELTNVIRLDLNYQNIQYLERNCFAGLDSLEVLYLASNEIKNISSGAFDGLNKLTDLDLNFNEFNEFQFKTEHFVG
jgi:hypothetical protein